jgi:hypothetical protein
MSFGLELRVKGISEPKQAFSPIKVVSF